MLNIEPYRSCVQPIIAKADDPPAENTEDRVNTTLLDTISSCMAHYSNMAYNFAAGVFECLSDAVMCLVNKIKSFVGGLFGVSQSEEHYLKELEDKRSSVIILSKALKIDIKRLDLIDPEVVTRKFEKIQALTNTQETEETLRNIETIDLAFTGLKTLPEGIFDKFEKLKVLFLVDNELEVISEGIFDKLKKLNELDLSSNQLKELPQGIFDKLEELQHLYVELNELNEITKEYLSAYQERYPDCQVIF